MTLDEAEKAGAYIVAGYLDYKAKRLGQVTLDREVLWDLGMQEWFEKEVNGEEPQQVEAPKPRAARKTRAKATVEAVEDDKDDTPEDDVPDAE